MRSDARVLRTPSRRRQRTQPKTRRWSQQHSLISTGSFVSTSLSRILCCVDKRRYRTTHCYAKTATKIVSQNNRGQAKRNVKSNVRSKQGKRTQRKTWHWSCASRARDVRSARAPRRRRPCASVRPRGRRSCGGTRAARHASMWGRSETVGSPARAQHKVQVEICCVGYLRAYQRNPNNRTCLIIIHLTFGRVRLLDFYFTATRGVRCRASFF